MENPDARKADQQKRNVIHIEYCTNCQSHNWNTHHNQAKYHETYIKLKNLIEDSFRQNPPIVFANKVPPYLTSIKAQENKYYNQLTKKYMFFPNIGSFQITLNGELMFSKKKTNNWPCFQTILEELSMKMYSQPFETKSKTQKKELNHTQTEFSSDEKLNSQGYKTLYKNQNKNLFKNFGKFTLTDHFKSFHQPNICKSQELGYCFDSSTTIKQSPDNMVKNNINVEDIDGLRRALKDSTVEQKENNSSNKEHRKSNEKQIIINLCSIEEESPHIKEGADFCGNSVFKKPSVLANTYPVQIIPGYNNSEKSLSLKRFEELSNDLRKIQKQFQHIQKKMIINGQVTHPQNYNSMDESTLNNQAEEIEKSRNQSQSGFVRSKFNDKENFASHHLERYSKQNRLLAYISNLQNSQIKATDRYDERYISPTYYEENELNKNAKCKKLSEIEKYLKSNNEQKNKKLKRIYGDWKVGTNNLNYLYDMENNRKYLLRDSTNTNTQSLQKTRVKVDRSSSSSSSSTVSEEEKSRVKNVESKQNKSNESQECKIKKHSSFIIKNKSLNKNSSNSTQKLSKYSLNDKSVDTEAKQTFNKTVTKSNHEEQLQKHLKQAYMKQNSKSFQVNASKSRPSGNLFAKREKYSMVQTSHNLQTQLDQRGNIQSRQSNRAQEITSSNGLKEVSQCSKSKSSFTVSNNNDPSQIKISHSSFEEKIEKENKSLEQLPKIQETRQIQVTQKSTNQKCENKITIEFHEFQLQVKSKRQQNQVPQNQDKAQLPSQNVERDHKELEEKNIQDPEEDPKILNEEKKFEEKKKDLSISREVYVQLDLHEMSQSQIMKTKPIEQVLEEQVISQPNQQINLEVPMINLKSNYQDPIQTNEPLRSSTDQNANSKSCSSNGYQNSEKGSKNNSHSRSSSMYDHPTFSHAMSHNLLEHSHCKCEQRIEKLETNRMKLESQRKEKQLIKEKKYEETQRRREMLQKEKQEYLKQLEIQLKEKRDSISNRKNEPSPKISTSHKKSLQKEKFSKETRKSLAKQKRVFSQEVQIRKSQKLDDIKGQKKEMNNQSTNQNKPSKSITETVSKKQNEEMKKPKTILETNARGRNSSKNSFTNKTTQLSQEVPRESQLQNMKKEVKESKSISHNPNPTNLTRKASNHRNKSYFMTEKQAKTIKSNTQVSKAYQDDEINHFKTQHFTQVEVQVHKDDQRGKLASIAIQTMGFDNWKKYNEHEEIQNDRALSKRNKSIQSRNSSASVRSVRQSLQSERKNEIVKEIYGPVEIEVKDGKTRVKKSKRETNLRESQFKQIKISKSKNNSKRHSSVEGAERNSSRDKTIVNIFEDEEDNEQMRLKHDSDQEDFQISYRGERQKALILKQLYNMNQHLSHEMKAYETLYQDNKLYQIAKKQSISKCDEPVFQSLIQKQENGVVSNKQNLFTQVENCKKTDRKISLFGADSVQIHNLKSNKPHLTRNLHKVLHILCQKNELLIVRLFQDYKSESNIFYENKNTKVLLQKSKYAVWLCINKTWKLIVVDNFVPVQEEPQTTVMKPLFSYHQSNQLWPQILEKCMAEAVGSYQKLFQLSIGELFSILNGSNHLVYTINQNISKNKLFLKEITQNDKKNFIMVCEKHPMNLKQQNQNINQTTKVFYLVSKKLVHNGQNEQILFKMRESNLDESIPNPEPYYIRYDNFCSKFKTCEVLHLRQHHNFCSLPLNQTFFSNKSKKSEQSYFNVIELIFDQQSFGTITVCNQAKSNIKTYLYKLQNSDNQIMKLVGEASKLNKKELFFDCVFHEQKYYLFIQTSNPNSVVSFMGESRPEIKIKEQILSNGLRNQSIEYLPVLDYEGLEKGFQTQGSFMRKSINSNFNASKIQPTKKFQSMDDLREMFIELLVQEKRRK